MGDINIINNYIDAREFRNYIQGVLIKHGYKPVEIDDSRLSDDDPSNDNDMLATKSGITYTVQTYLSTTDNPKKITIREINETLNDMNRENVSSGIIITNGPVSDNAKEEAKNVGISIIDNERLEDYINI